jgi:chromosome segregation ATPase
MKINNEELIKKDKLINLYKTERTKKEDIILKQTQKIKEIEAKISTNSEDLEEYKAEATKLKEEKRKLLERNQKLGLISEEMEGEVKKAKASAVQLDCKNYELMEEMKDLQAELEFCREEAKQKTLIESQVHELQRERLRLSRENEKFKNSKTLRKLKENEQTIIKLRKQVELLTKQKNDLISENKKYVGFTLKSQEDLKKNGNQVQVLEKENEDLMTRIKILEKEIQSGKEDVSQKVSTLTLRNIKLHAQNTSLKRNLAEVKKENEKAEEGIREKIKKYQESLAEMRSKNRELNTVIKKGNISRGPTKADLEGIKKEKGIIRDLAHQKNEMEKKMVESQSEMKRFKLKYEDALTRLKQKESHLKFICEEFIASTSISNVPEFKK